MALEAQKNPLQKAATVVARRVGAGLDWLQQRGMPVSIKSVGQNGQILELNFETDPSVHTIPTIMVPVWNPRYVRYPWAQGDKGCVIPLNLGIGNMSGLGPNSPAPFVNPANLAAGVFMPIGNVNDEPPDNPQALQHNAPQGTISRDDNKKSQVSTHPTNGTQIASGGDGSGNYSHTMTATPSGTKINTSAAHTLQATNATLDAQGNLTSATSMGAPTGSFGSGSMGGMSMAGGILSSVAGLLIIDTGQNTGTSSVTANTITGQLVYTPAMTVALLISQFPPSPTYTGARAFVSDSTSTTFNATVTTGGGTLRVPVFCDGTNWRIG